MTYEQLKERIADTLNRQDLTSVIPTFIEMCESALNSDLNHFKQDKLLSITLDGRYTSLPSDWLSTHRLSLDTHESLSLISIDEMQALRKQNDITSTPIYYAHVADNFEVFPAADSESAELYYKVRLPALASEQNFVATDYPDIYLYGSLIHAAPYLQDDERLPIWLSLYTKSLEKANSQSNSSRYSGTGLKMRIK